jgi:glucose/arabinose dehydrogenase
LLLRLGKGRNTIARMRTLLTLVVVGVVASIAPAQSVVDPNLTVQTWVRGLSRPTGAIFKNARGDMFVTQQHDGRVMWVRDKRPVRSVLDLPVATGGEQGLLGIAASPNFAADNLLYLYHTAAAVWYK